MTYSKEFDFLGKYTMNSNNTGITCCSSTRRLDRPGGAHCFFRSIMTAHRCCLVLQGRDSLRPLLGSSKGTVDLEK